jgi:Tfp pilus assembly protein PilF
MAVALTIVIALFLCLYLVRGCNSNYSYELGKGYLKMALSEMRFDNNRALLIESSIIKALKADPKNPEILYELGKFYYYNTYYRDQKMSKKEQIEALLNAKKQFEKALHLKPTDYYSHIYLANINTDIIYFKLSNPQLHNHITSSYRDIISMASKHVEAALLLAPNNEYIQKQYTLWKDRMSWLVLQIESKG